MRMAGLIEQLRGRQAGPAVQFVKYGISGAVATAVHISIFSAMAWLVLPALTDREWVVRLLHLSVPDLTDAVRARNAAVDNFVAFLFSNLTAYLLNIIWVFHRGRHHWIVEIGLFYAVSGLSMVIGTTLQTALIARFGWTTTVAFAANLVTALLINYAMRKFVIFKG
jgi:putative flippase GtrA